MNIVFAGAWLMEDLVMLFYRVSGCDAKTILLASHNIDDIEILCDEVYEMSQGEAEENSCNNFFEVAECNISSYTAF